MIALLAMMASCATKKKVVYFQDSASMANVNVDSIYQHPKIQVNDLLKIDLTALEPETLLPFRFQKTVAQQPTNMRLELLQLEGYLVDQQGSIQYPGLGLVQVGGKTTQEVQALLEKQLSKFVKDVHVKVRLVNFKFTVLGEVKAPGTYTITEETINLPQALGMAGDLTIQGERESVLIFRQEEGVLTSKRIDLTSTDWIDSSYYYLRPNDMVYVEPNGPRVKSAGFIGNVGTVVSVVSILLSTAVIIFR
ncbi:polysaccharide biosynthesis/export family protein [Mesonia aestuariivivens]|nr:polysaccharide biosynthesis/export family protein [Mesonia aestuariivivens]